MCKLALEERLSRPMPYDPTMTAPDSPLAAALARVGDRWSLLLVEALLPGPRRFGELTEAIPGIAPNILSERLRRLEAEHVIRSTPYSERPPRFVYELTEGGRELAGALRLLAEWGAGEPLRHSCGTAVEARWWCPSCETIVDDAADDDVVHV